MDVDELKRLISLMNDNDLVELEYEEDGKKVRLRKANDNAVALPVPIPAAPVAHPSAAARPSEPGAPREAPPKADLVEIKSPLVGTFYRAPRPDAEPYVVEGDAIAEDRIVCLIEAMKVMNEIKAEVRGVVQEVLVKNGEPVEFGQPLFLVRRA